MCPVGVCSGSTLADPDRNRKANPGSGLGPLSVRLGPVGTVYTQPLIVHISAVTCATRTDYNPCALCVNVDRNGKSFIRKGSSKKKIK